MNVMILGCECVRLLWVVYSSRCHYILYPWLIIEGGQWRESGNATPSPTVAA